MAANEQRSPSDEDLLAACATGSSEALHKIITRYDRLVRSIARGYGLNAHDVDEVSQITFTIFSRSAARLRPDSRLAAWLSTVARRHTWRLLEASRRQGATPIDDQHATHDDVRLAAEQSANAEWVRSALHRLSPRCRTLVEALFLRPDEPSYAELAAEFGIAIGSIGPTRARCLDHLRALLVATEPRSGDPAGIAG